MLMEYFGPRRRSSIDIHTHGCFRGLSDSPKHDKSQAPGDRLTCFLFGFVFEVKVLP